MEQQSYLQSDGSLYADITPSSLGLPSVTPYAGLKIDYGEALWRKMGQIYLDTARALCPYDTGYLSENINFYADSGGVEVWSDAPYSGYQEYGTSKMRAQPYFEAAILEMQNDATIQSELESTVNRYNRIDRNIIMGENINSIPGNSELGAFEDSYSDYEEEGYSSSGIREGVNQTRQITSAMDAIGLGILDMLIQTIILTIVSLFTAPFKMIRDSNSKRDTDHNPIHTNAASRYTI